MGMMVGLTLGPAMPPSRRMAGSGAASLGMPLATGRPSLVDRAGGTSRLHSSSSSSQAWKALPPAMARASCSGGAASIGMTGMPARISAGATVSFSTSWSRLAPKAAKWARTPCMMASGIGPIQPSNSFQAERRRRMPTRNWCTCSELPARYTPSVSTSASTAALRAIWSRHSAAMRPMACAAVMSSRSLTDAAPRGAQNSAMAWARRLSRSSPGTASTSARRCANCASASPRSDLLRGSSTRLWRCCQPRATAKMAAGRPETSSNSSSEIGSSSAPARRMPVS